MIEIGIFLIFIYWILLEYSNKSQVLIWVVRISLGVHHSITAPGRSTICSQAAEGQGQDGTI